MWPCEELHVKPGGGGGRQKKTGATEVVLQQKVDVRMNPSDIRDQYPPSDLRVLSADLGGGGWMEALWVDD